MGNKKESIYNILVRLLTDFNVHMKETDSKEDNDPGAMNSNFNVEDLFRLEKMAFAVEISLAKARKEDSRIRIRNKEELLHALTDKETLS